MKLIYTAFSIILPIGLLGCTETSSVNSTEPVEEAATETTTTSESTTDSFKSELPDSAPTLKVGTSNPAPPFIFKDEYGGLQGIDIDVIHALAEDQGFKVEIYDDPWTSLFDNVAEGKRDLAIGGISYDTERAEKYALSDSYFFNPSAIMYMDSTLTINGLEDLKGLRVASNPDTKQLAQLKEMDGFKDLVEIKTHYLMFQKLLQDNVDAVVLDKPILQYTAKNHPEYELQIVAYENKDNPDSQTVILASKDNIALINQVNDGIRNLQQNGEIERISNKWLLSEDNE